MTDATGPLPTRDESDPLSHQAVEEPSSGHLYTGSDGFVYESIPGKAVDGEDMNNDLARPLEAALIASSTLDEDRYPMGADPAAGKSLLSEATPTEDQNEDLANIVNALVALTSSFTKPADAEMPQGQGAISEAAAGLLAQLFPQLQQDQTDPEATASFITDKFGSRQQYGSHTPVKNDGGQLLCSEPVGFGIEQECWPNVSERVAAESRLQELTAFSPDMEAPASEGKQGQVLLLPLHSRRTNEVDRDRAEIVDILQRTGVGFHPAGLSWNAGNGYLPSVPGQHSPSSYASVYQRNDPPPEFGGSATPTSIDTSFGVYASQHEAPHRRTSQVDGSGFTKDGGINKDEQSSKASDVQGGSSGSGSRRLHRPSYSNASFTTVDDTQHASTPGASGFILGYATRRNRPAEAALNPNLVPYRFPTHQDFLPNIQGDLTPSGFDRLTSHPTTPMGRSSGFPEPWQCGACLKDEAYCNGCWRGRRHSPPPESPSNQLCAGSRVFRAPLPSMEANSPSALSAPPNPQAGFIDSQHHQTQHHRSAQSSSPKSALLSEFKAGTVQITNLMQIEKQLCDFARDQVGARFIQSRLSNGTPAEAQVVRKALMPRIKGLITDAFGNHIVQRLLETGTPAQRHALFEQIQGDILRLSLQTYGCRVMQKALEAWSLPDKIAFADELQQHVVRCVEDQNGNHVIQKCIEQLPPKHIQFVIDAFQRQVARVSMHCYGCRVVQRVLEHCPHSQIGPLLDEVIGNFVTLAQDQYGNYVVQHVLRYGREEDKRAIVDRIAEELLVLSSHKFSSNVVEKCLEIEATKDARLRIMRAAFGAPNNPRPPVLQMVRDRYANYVVQRMLDVTIQDNDAAALISEVVTKLERHLPALRKFTYGKHIATALERLSRQLDERLWASKTELEPEGGKKSPKSEGKRQKKPLERGLVMPVAGRQG